MQAKGNGLSMARQIATQIVRDVSALGQGNSVVGNESEQSKEQFDNLTPMSPY